MVRCLHTLLVVTGTLLHTSQCSFIRSGSSLSTGIKRPSTRWSSTSLWAGIKPTDLFSQWAETGRDEKMALGHDVAVTEMLVHMNGHIDKPFSFLDIGCGNGWVSRRVKSNPLCSSSQGIDGATQMIKKARLIEESEKTGASFTHADLLEHQLIDKVDVAFSMEVLYYMTETDLKTFLRKLSSQWVVSGGLLCIGLDHYYENTPSHGWAELNNTHMLLWSEAQWRSALEAAGFEIITLWRAAPGREEIPEGTLAIIARNCHQDKDDGITP